MQCSDSTVFTDPQTLEVWLYAEHYPVIPLSRLQTADDGGVRRMMRQQCFGRTRCKQPRVPVRGSSPDVWSSIATKLLQRSLSGSDKPATEWSVQLKHRCFRRRSPLAPPPLYKNQYVTDGQHDVHRESSSVGPPTRVTCNLHLALIINSTPVCRDKQTCRVGHQTYSVVELDSIQWSAHFHHATLKSAQCRCRRAAGTSA